jgi:hypothetical protein
MLVGRTQYEPWVKKTLNRQNRRWLLLFEGNGPRAQGRPVRVSLVWAIGSTLLYLRSAGGARLEDQVSVVIRNRVGAVILATLSRMRWEKAYPLPCSWSTRNPP